MNRTIAPQYAYVNQLFKLWLPEDTFVDPNEDPLKIKCKFQPERPEAFYCQENFLEWTPTEANAYQYGKTPLNVTLMATDPYGGRDQTFFTITVQHPLHFGSNIRLEYLAVQGHEFNWRFNKTQVVINPENRPFHLTVISEPLLSQYSNWINITSDEAGCLLNGTPPKSWVGPVLLSLVATDEHNPNYNQNISLPFVVKVEEYRKPKAVVPILNYKAEVGPGAPDFRPPPISLKSIFDHQDAAYRLNYSYKLGASWLKNQTTSTYQDEMYTIYGKPSVFDPDILSGLFRQGFYLTQVTLIATDADGQSATVTLNIEISGLLWLRAVMGIFLVAVGGKAVFAGVNWLGDKCLSHGDEIELAVGDNFSYKLKTPARAGYAIHTAMPPVYTKWGCLLNENSIISPDFMGNNGHRCGGDDLELYSVKPIPAAWNNKEVHALVTNETRCGLKFLREKVIIHITDDERKIPANQPRLTRWRGSSKKYSDNVSPLLQYSHFSRRNNNRSSSATTQIEMTAEINPHSRAQDDRKDSKCNDKTPLLPSLRPRSKSYSAINIV